MDTEEEEKSEADDDGAAEGDSFRGRKAAGCDEEEEDASASIERSLSAAGRFPRWRSSSSSSKSSSLQQQHPHHQHHQQQQPGGARDPHRLSRQACAQAQVARQAFDVWILTLQAKRADTCGVWGSRTNIPPPPPQQQPLPACAMQSAPVVSFSVKDALPKRTGVLPLASKDAGDATKVGVILIGRAHSGVGDRSNTGCRATRQQWLSEARKWPCTDVG